MTPDNSLWYRMIQQRRNAPPEENEIGWLSQVSKDQWRQAAAYIEAIREAHEILKQDLLDPEFSEEDKAFLLELKIRA